MVFREATGGESKGWEKGERRGGKFVAGARPSTPRHGEKAAPIFGDSLAIRRGRGLQRQTGDASPTDESEKLPTRSQSYLGQISVRCRSDLSPISEGFAVGISRRSPLVQSGDFALTPALATKTTVVGLWSPARRFSGGSGLLSDARDRRGSRQRRRRPFAPQSRPRFLRDSELWRRGRRARDDLAAEDLEAAFWSRPQGASRLWSRANRSTIWPSSLGSAFPKPSRSQISND